MKNQIKLISSPKNEAQHQVNVMAWSVINREKYPELRLLHHVPNGGTRDIVEAKRLKDQGVKPGVPDLCLPVSRGKYHALYIELKSETGAASEEQKWWIGELNAQGYFAEICHGYISAIRAIEWYLSLGGAVNE